MRKKLKLLASLSTFCLAIAVLCFGVFAAIKVTYSVSGTISYEVNDAYVEMDTVVYAGTSAVKSNGVVDNIKTLLSGSTSGLEDYETEVDFAYSSVTETEEEVTHPVTGLELEGYYTYYLVTSITNLSEKNVYAQAITPTLPTNIYMVDSGIQTTIAKDETKKIIIALAVEDYTQSISLSDGAFTVGVEVNVWGEEITSGEELLTTNVTYTLSDDDSYYTIEQNENSTGNITGIPTFIDQVPVTTVGDFADNEDITGIQLPLTVNTFVENAFNYCINLSLVNVPEGVTELSTSCFYCCGKIREITLPSTLEVIGDCALGMEEYSAEEGEEWGLTSLEIPNTVTTIGCQAISWQQLTTITIPANVEVLDSTFENSTTLEEVIFANNSKLKTMLCTFSGCTSLESITIPSRVESISGDTLSECINLTSITVEEGNEVYTSRDNSGVEKNCIIDIEGQTIISGCQTTVIPTDGSVTKIGDYAFRGQDDLTQIEIPNTIEEIAEYAFSACESLARVTFAENSQLTTIGERAFVYCSSLAEVTIPSSVTSIGESAFCDCDNLSSITFMHAPEDEMKLTIGANAFDKIKDGAKAYIQSGYTWTSNNNQTITSTTINDPTILNDRIWTIA